MTDASIAVAGVLVDASTFVRGGFSARQGLIARLGAPAAAHGARRLAVAGLRNAHVHLDLSLVCGVPRAIRGFAEWVRALLRCRGPFDPAFFQRGAEAGCREAISTGTTAVGDIDSSGAATAVVAASGLKGIAFKEVLGSGRDDATLADCQRWIDGFPNFAPAGRIVAGISPHAPYSTSAGIYRGAGRLAREHGVPLTTHIAEALAERDFLEHGGGEFRDLLAGLNAPSPRADSATPVRPLAYLDELGVLGPGRLLAHVNYPEPDDLERLARTESVVVFCPRSHAFFGHARHPVARYLEAGIAVALGTDSRASNGSLDLFDELAYLRAARPDLSPALLWTLATQAGAKALRTGSGRLAEGEPADAAIVEFAGDAPATAAEAVDALTLGAGRVVATLIDGAFVHVDASARLDSLPLTEVG